MAKKEIVEINKNSDQYPKLLKNWGKSPERLFVLGSADALNKPSLAIVGTRKATTQGLKIAENMAHDLASCGFSIISGLALGIDAAAHRGALKAKGTTIAVLGRGLDEIYPAQNENLAREMIKAGGAIVSEYPPGTPAYPANFLERNRITAGLAFATIIIEAPFRSGSINTASWAADQGKPVFVVPGPINSVNYGGSHKLIRDGATLVASSTDVLEDLGIEIKSLKQKTEPENQAENIIFETLRNAGKPLNIDEIIEASNLNVSEANTALTMLTIRKIILETPEGYTV